MFIVDSTVNNRDSTQKSLHTVLMYFAPSAHIQETLDNFAANSTGSGSVLSATTFFNVSCYLYFFVFLMIVLTSLIWYFAAPDFFSARSKLNPALHAKQSVRWTNKADRRRLANDWFGWSAAHKSLTVTVFQHFLGERSIYSMHLISKQILRWIKQL